LRDNHPSYHPFANAAHPPHLIALARAWSDDDEWEMRNGLYLGVMASLDEQEMTM
jgi:hypothetical protein